MAVVKEMMYVIGGNIYHENDDVEHRPVPVELFDPKKEMWEMLDIKSDGITLRSVCVLDDTVWKGSTFFLLFFRGVSRPFLSPITSKRQKRTGQKGTEWA